MRHEHAPRQLFLESECERPKHLKRESRSPVGFFVKLIFTKKLINTLLEKNIFNYYQSDLYSRNSKILSITALKTFNKNFASAVID